MVLLHRHFHNHHERLTHVILLFDRPGRQQGSTSPFNYRPSQTGLYDVQSLIANSGIDNSGIKNTLIVKVETAQDQLAKNQSPDALNALHNQLNAIAGKHGLYQAQVDLIQMMISTITG